MIKIKKFVYKILTVVLALLVVLNTSAIGVLAESANPNAVTPGPEDYAFSNGTITGLKADYLRSLTDEQKPNIRLEIPDEINGVKVTAIGNNAFQQSRNPNCWITYVKFPTNLSSVGEVAFSGQNRITEIDFSSCIELKELKKSAFRKCSSLTGVLYIPSTVQLIGRNTFGETGLSVLYLPKMLDQSKKDFINDYSFYGSDSLKEVICADKEDYGAICKLITTLSQARKLTYPIAVSFNDGNNGVYPDIERLYNRTYNYVKQSDSTWKSDTNYKFPSVINGQNKVWSLKQNVNEAVKEGDLVKPEDTSQTLYAVDAIEDPIITYSENVDKEFDGENIVLSVTAKHPLAKPIDEAKEGDVVFHYAWKWALISGEEEAPKGFDKNVYDIGADVRSPSGAICSVTVKACTVKGPKAVPFYTDTHDFAINLRQAEPTVNPVVEKNVLYLDNNTGQLPEISLSEGDTPGTISWDSNQNLKDEIDTYRWTFTPANNIHGVSNYKAKTGSVSIYCAKKDLTTEELGGKIDQLPEIKDDGQQPTDDQKTAILDALLSFETAASDIKNQITEEKQDQLYDAVKKLPNIEIGYTTPDSMNLSAPNDLTRNITPEDIIKIKDGKVLTYKLELIAQKEQVTDEEKEAINMAEGNATLVDNYDIKLVKKIDDGKNTTTENISETNHPITLVFSIPQNLQSANRKFFMIHLHVDANGKITVEKLPDEDNNPATLTVTNGKFSTYAIAYTEDNSSGGSSGGGVYVYDITASAGEHGAITPEGKVFAYYGSTKTFDFTPDEGYEVADVMVDGVSVGAVSSYTFEQVTKAHTIAVTFQPVSENQDRIINGVKATTIKAWSSAKKGSITVKWKKSGGFKVDYYQVFRSTKKNSGYGTKAFYTTKTGKQKSYKNTKKLKKGTRYYYKVRGVRTIDGVKVYTKWSNKAIRIAK